MNKRIKVGGRIAKLTAWYPLQLILFLLYKAITYIVNILLTLLLVGIITGVAVSIAFVMYISEYVDPDYDGLDNLQISSAKITEIRDINGEKIDDLRGTENRMWAEYTEIKESQYLINAFIAIEDKRFFEHEGVDYKRTGNAVLNFFMPSGDSSGGSTITQQLIKTVSEEDDVTIQRKIQEILRALNVETKFSKEEILEMYLNTIYLSQNTNGVKAAAQAYFGKSLDKLTLVECAALASIPKSPTKYDPVRNPNYNLQRRNLVLQQMLEQELISQAEYDEAYDKVLDLVISADEDYEEKVHSYFVDALMDQVVEDLCAEYGYDKTTASRILYSGGLEIESTLNQDVQNAIEKIFTDDGTTYLYIKGDAYDTSSGVKPQAAMVIMDPKTGNVLGLVGGRGEKKESRGFNRATHSKRQCGSSIKPLSVYSLAIDKGFITYGTPIDDVPTMIFDDKYWPGNTPSGFRGIVSVNYAVMKSLNTVAVYLTNKINPDVSFSFLRDTLGFTSIVESVEIGDKWYSDSDVSPISLGSFTYGVTVMEMTSGYCMLANGGRTSSPRLYTEIRDSLGSIVLSNGVTHKVAIAEKSAYVMTSILKNVISSNGTGYRVTLDDKFDVEVAAKTGSTNDDRDRYFMGYTPDYVGGVWFGYDNNKSLSGYSVNPALSLWDNVMNEIYTTLEAKGTAYTKTFYQNVTGMIEVEYCTVSGKLPSEYCEHDYFCEINGGSCIEKGVFEIGKQPTTVCDCHIPVMYDTTTGSLCLDGCHCPQEYLKEIVLRKNTTRTFKSYVSVADSQYIYMPVPAGYMYPSSTAVPFYANLFEAGTYFGLKSSIGRPVNSVCLEHYGAAPQQTTAALPATTNPSG